jgi:hypothetical protein
VEAESSSVMSNADRYKKEQDLIFQEIEEMEQLERQQNQSIAARERIKALLRTPQHSEYFFRLLHSKAFRGLLDTAPSTEERWLMIEEVVHAWEKTARPAGTQA